MPRSPSSTSAARTRTPSRAAAHTQAVIAFAMALVVGLASTVSWAPHAHAQEATEADEVDAGLAPEPEPQAEPAPAGSIATTESPENLGDPEEDPRETAREQLRAARVGEIAARTRAALQTARPLVRASGEVTRIERALPRIEADIRRLSHPARLARIPRLSQRELSDLRQEWRRHAHRLEGWQATIAARESEVEEARTSLVELKRTWQDLRDVSEVAERPEPRHSRIVAGLDEARRGLAELETARDDLATLSDRVSDVQIIVEDVADQLRDAASAYRERLGVQDAPPLYEGLVREDAAASVAEQARDTLAERTETPAELLMELVPAAIALLVAFMGLYVLLLQLGRSRARNGGEDRAAIGELATEVLQSPASSAALLAMLGAAVLVEHAPIVVYDALFFATLVPLYRAVPPLSPPPLRPLVRGVLVFVALDRVQSMLAEGSSLLRVVLLVEGLVGGVALVLWLRSHAGGARWWARVLALATVTLFALSVGANAIGYLFFATVLTRGIGYSAYTGVSMAGAVVVTEAIVDLVVVSPFGQRLRSLREHAALVHARALRVLGALAALAWLAATLEGFGIWGPLSSWARKFLREDHEIGSLHLSLGAVLGAVAILLATSATLRLVRFVLEQDVLPRLALEPGVDGAISGLARYVLGGTGLLFALAYLGIDASQIALVAGALGVGIGFGLQGIVANFIAGIVLMLERPVRLGDFIEVGALVGSVERIGLRSSTVKALDGAEVIVPNESLISREVVNWTLSDRKRRVEVKVGVAYGTDPHRVIEILRRVATEHRDPTVGIEPEVLFEQFGESSLDFTLQFWAKTFADSIELKSEVGLAVHDALVAAGIEIPFPQRDVRIVSQPGPEPQAIEPQAIEPQAIEPRANEPRANEPQANKSFK
ncbi:MAG: mechanosensitive ion channel [Sandaracinus sp.]